MTRPHRPPVARNGILGPKNPKSVTSRSVTWRCLILFRCCCFAKKPSLRNLFYGLFFLGRTPTRACNNAPFSEGFLEGFSSLRRVLKGVLQWVLMGRRVLRRVLRRGSKKGLSRRHLEGRSTPFREYDPAGVCPILVDCDQNCPAFSWTI